MPWSFSSLGCRLRSWLWDYDSLQALAVVLLYLQIGCSLLGSLSALYNGVLLINLVVALFALVAIESSSQVLGRTYAVLLLCSILLDMVWFIFFSHSIWNVDPETYEPVFVFSLRLALSMEIIGFSVRFLSSFLWIQMYRLGISSIVNTPYCEADYDMRNSLLGPSHGTIKKDFTSDEILGGSAYDRAYFSSLFEDGQDKGCSSPCNNVAAGHDWGSTSAAQASQLESCNHRAFHVIDDDNTLRKTLIC